MKRIALVLLALATCHTAMAEDDAAERARIAQARKDVQAQFAAEEKACRARFAVTDCENAANRKRNAALADLRRREVALNDAERRARAAEKLRELHERQASDTKEAQEQRRAQGLESQREREERAAEKSRKAAERAAQAATTKPPRAPKAQREGPTAAEAEANRRAHEERVQEAQERKARVLKRNAERGKPPAAPLPRPAASS